MAKSKRKPKQNSKTNLQYRIDLSCPSSLNKAINKLKEINFNKDTEKTNLVLTLINRPGILMFLGNIQCEYSMSLCSEQYTIWSRKLSLGNISKSLLLTIDDLMNKQDLILFRFLKDNEQIYKIADALFQNHFAAVNPSQLYFQLDLDDNNPLHFHIQRITLRSAGRNSLNDFNHLQREPGNYLGTICIDDLDSIFYPNQKYRLYNLLSANSIGSRVNNYTPCSLCQRNFPDHKWTVYTQPNSNNLYISEENFTEIREYTHSESEFIYIASNQFFQLPFTNGQLVLQKLPHFKAKRIILGYEASCTDVKLVSASGFDKTVISLVEFFEVRNLTWWPNGELILEKDGYSHQYPYKTIEKKVCILMSEFEMDPTPFVNPDRISLNGKSSDAVIHRKPSAPKKPNSKAIHVPSDFPDPTPNKAPAEENSPESSSQIFNAEEHILYIHKGNIICQKNEHPVEAVTIQLANINNQKSPVELQAFYCSKCQKYFIHNNFYEEYLKKYSFLPAVFQYVSPSGTFNSTEDLAAASPLAMCGYSVSKQHGYSSAYRQRMLKEIIDNHILSQTEVVRYLNWFIDYHGKRKNMGSAVSKWREDLRFVQGYKAHPKNETVTSIKRYKR